MSKQHQCMSLKDGRGKDANRYSFSLKSTQIALSSIVILVAGRERGIQRRRVSQHYSRARLDIHASANNRSCSTLSVGSPESTGPTGIRSGT